MNWRRDAPAVILDIMVKKSVETRRRPAPPPRRDYSRRRAICLATVYLLFIVHLIHWKLAGRTLAPLELNEVMYTLELGIVTAGFVFMAIVLLATVFFGRFFCSWGCHILALEDLAAWLLSYMRIHPKPIRSRLLKWVPVTAMLYMFVWPQLRRWLERRPMPALHLRTDEQGWASFLTADFWRNLPGLGVTLLTFFVCGFVIVYMLGSRGFCTYACPYGAIFRIADRFAPGRIVARGDCSQCGKCTAVCQSHVLVHRELAAFGRVTDPACLKDLDCVAACPEGRIAYGLAQPAILTIGSTARVARPPYDFTWAEELVMACVLIASLLIFRGLYDLVPFLLTLAIGCILAYWTVLVGRSFRRRDLRFNRWQIKAHGSLTRGGRVFATATIGLLALTVHSGFIRYHAFRGNRLFDSVVPTLPDRSIAAGAEPSTSLLAAIDHFEACERWGLFHPVDQRRRLADLHGASGRTLAEQGRLNEAAVHLARAVQVYPWNAQGQYNHGVILATLGRTREAIGAYRRAIELAPHDADAHNNLGLLLAETGDWVAAEHHLTRAIQLRPAFAAARFNLGRLNWALGRFDAARRLLEEAANLDATYAPPVREMLKATE
ncbi:MAG: hypothetical protein DCC66_00080 [Planctomycetota bacterium]|nr:MAG: hypothetical protein DCC66_00080 [Planctomycetota bacterium]